ncbi:MAG: RNB domain-containing ribonuclease, partial [Bacilli bacterium]|nr:RNB domain-containing ribonuclease [Bacilli bacterium]
KPTEIILRDRGTGEKLIEDFMIAANECVATHIYFMSLPFIYRVHEVPKEEKLRSYLSFVGSLGYQVPGDLKDTSPKTVQRIIKYLEDKPEFKILSSLLLRSMQKAVYRPENLGHYGLASQCYTHFTSPIRRYPDTTVHRLLRTYLFNKELDMGTIRKWEQKLVYISEHSSDRERASVDCEREVEDMKMAEYMEDHIGEEYEGMISSVTSFGMFIELDNLIEGLVPLRDMKDFFHYDEEHMTLTGERSHVKYTIGERVLVKVVRASKEEKTIDFEIIRKL